MRSAVRSTGPHVIAHSRSRGALRPAEIADAGVFAALAVVIVSVGAFLPHLGAIELLSIVPFAVVGLRNRARAVVAAVIAAAFVAFLVAGATATLVAAGSGVLGGLCGIIRRHGRGSGTVALAAAGLSPVSAALVVGTLFLFSGARNLAFGSLHASVAGIGRVIESQQAFRSTVHAVEGIGDALLGAWPAVVAAVVLVAVPAGMLLANVLTAAVARRVEWLAHADPLDHAARADAVTDAPVAPVPLEFVGVGSATADPGGTRSRMSISPSRRGSSSRSSARTVLASPRSYRCSPAPSRPAAGSVALAGSGSDCLAGRR
jgi:hypothetical protein